METYQRLTEIQTDLRAGKLSCVEIVQQYLTKISALPEINAFVEVYAEEAREAAIRIDAKLRKGTAGRLAGLVIGVKDVICHEGHGLTASSKMLEGFESLFTATALQRLLDEDAIVIGRQGCDEFAMGSTSESSTYGPVLNPLNPQKVPGGSSGGSAAAIAAGMCHASIGSDTGGSVRQPAGFCGLVGMKPTYGRVSRWGLIAYASSFDQISPITRSVEDAALLLEIMAGEDHRDNTASSQPVAHYSNHLSTPQKETYKVGYLKEALESPGLDPAVKAGMEAQIQQLKAAGHEILTIDFPLLEYLVPCYYILTTAEASSNLSRYDGVRYGFRADGVKDLNELYAKSRTQGFGKEVKRRILLGTFVLCAGYYDAYYTQAMKVRRLLRDQTDAIFEQCDFLIMPTTPSTAFDLGEAIEDPIAMYLSDIFTVYANLVGAPAISLPLGKGEDGMPFGIQLMAKHFEEAELLGFAHRM